jgi:hypothetical protein
MPRGVRRRQISGANVSYGFCVSCGVTRSSRFRRTSEEWKMYYHELPNLRENRKRGSPKICNTCYRRFCMLSSDKSMPGENQVANEITRPLIKKSSIGGNGKLQNFR